MLRDQRGEVVPATAAKIIFAAFGLAIAILFLSVGVTYFKVATSNSELVRYIEIVGDYSNCKTKMNSLFETVGLDPANASVSVTATPVRQSKIQYGSEFSVTITYKKHFKIGNDSNKWFYIDWEIPITSTTSGRSEQYWK